jgi:hypothetical protein
MPSAERRVIATRTLFSRIPKSAHAAIASLADRGASPARRSFKMRCRGLGVVDTCGTLGRET